MFREPLITAFHSGRNDISGIGNPKGKCMFWPESANGPYSAVSESENSRYDALCIGGFSVPVMNSVGCEIWGSLDSCESRAESSFDDRPSRNDMAWRRSKERHPQILSLPGPLNLP